jgi:ABC-2 type transport system ATP-binding protein
MKRRLDLGASLVGAPRLLLLDEPTTGLDPRSRIELWDAIRALVEAGTDVLLTTQYLDEADQLAGQVAIIDRGRTIAAGTPVALKRLVGGDVVEVHARRSELAAAAQALDGLGEGRPQVDEATRRVTVGVAGRDGLLTAMRSLESLMVDVEDIGLRPPTLDEVFLALTGHHADTDDQARQQHAA